MWFSKRSWKKRSVFLLVFNTWGNTYILSGFQSQLHICLCDVIKKILFATKSVFFFFLTTLWRWASFPVSHHAFSLGSSCIYFKRCTLHKQMCATSPPTITTEKRGAFVFYTWAILVQMCAVIYWGDLRTLCQLLHKIYNFNPWRNPVKLLEL